MFQTVTVTDLMAACAHLLWFPHSHAAHPHAAAIAFAPLEPLMPGKHDADATLQFRTTIVQ
jgi:hypothetical protein